MTKKQKKRGLLQRIGKDLYKNRILYLMVLPAVLFYFVFCYVPMGGIIVAFKRFNYYKGIFGSDWVGLANFKTFFASGKIDNGCPGYR